MGVFAGPMLACAFAAPSEDWNLVGLNDSKKLTDKDLVVLSKELMRQYPKSFEMVWGSVEDIDRHGLGKTWKRAMEEAILRLIARVGVPDRVIVDGNKQPTFGAECYPEADANFPSVSAASIIAKVTRDEYMVRQSMTYPLYGFDHHVGYGTKRHRAAIIEHGICPLHRRSVKTIKAYMARTIPVLGPGT